MMKRGVRNRIALGLIIFAIGVFVGRYILPPRATWLADRKHSPEYGTGAPGWQRVEHSIRTEYLPLVHKIDSAMEAGQYRSVASLEKQAVGYLLIRLAGDLRGLHLALSESNETDEAIDICDRGIALFDDWYGYDYYGHPDEALMLVIRKAWLSAPNADVDPFLHEWAQRSDKLGKLSEFVLLRSPEEDSAGNQVAGLKIFCNKYAGTYWAGRGFYELAQIAAREGDFSKARRYARRAVPLLGPFYADFAEYIAGSNDQEMQKLHKEFER